MYNLFLLSALMLMLIIDCMIVPSRSCVFIPVPFTEVQNQANYQLCKNNNVQRNAWDWKFRGACDK